MRVRFIIPLLEPVRIQNRQKQSNEKPEAQVEQRLKSRLKSWLESRLESPLAVKVLVKLQETGKSALAQYLGHKTVSGELHKQIRRLLELELIEMTLPDKPNSRLQKYRLTTKGLELISHKADAIYKSGVHEKHERHEHKESEGQDDE
jgi:ATP-dependent DNA helicase RecG